MEENTTPARKFKFSNTTIAIIAIIVLIIVAIIYRSSKDDGAELSSDAFNNFEISSTSTDDAMMENKDTVMDKDGDAMKATATTQTITLALLDTENKKQGVKSGCDTVVMTSKVIPATITPLSASMRELILATDTGEEPLYNHLSEGALAFDRATIDDGLARIYFTGTAPTSTDSCDDSRMLTQVEKTALQFPTVTKVEVYLNNALVVAPTEAKEE